MIRNERQKMGGARLLAGLPDGRAALAFLDPQYRAVLDKLKYGNEGARGKGRAALPQMSDADISLFVEEIERALRRSGHLMLWVDKFTIASGGHLGWLRHARSLKIVDLIHWNKTRPGMGRRARCYSEYLVVVQKEPTRAKGIWTDRGIPDSWVEGADRETHVHAKPVALAIRLIRATTKRDDIVIDPCAGGYGVLEACRATGRQFIGCDLV